MWHNMREKIQTFSAIIYYQHVTHAYAPETVNNSKNRVIISTFTLNIINELQKLK